MRNPFRIFVIPLLFSLPAFAMENSGGAGGSDDPHSFSHPDEIAVKHLDLDILVNFETKQLTGKASLHLDHRKKADRLFLDTRDLTIEKVLSGEGDALSFQKGADQGYLGQELSIQVTPETKVVHIYYSTSPTANALQWLDPSQTAGGKYPFLYSQSQSIFARTWVPCQDTPGVRMTYNARVQVPPELLALMSAENPKEKNSSGIYEFRMPYPIPSYLLAIAVGDIAFRPTGERTGVYAEPSVVEKAAWEFAETPKMMDAVEKLYGPYRWGRYDLIILPPSFPWGGMENPMLTFLTPTLIAGDRSLVSTIAHELAHSWSGNLVTNATWNDFWLNEGFTDYLTHRIMEVVYGESYEEMLSVLGFQDLERTVKELDARDTFLKGNYTGRDPEEAATQIPYEKGQFFLRTVEAAVGRETFDAFLKGYFAKFSFQSLTTEQFLPYMRESLLQGDSNLEEKLQVNAWVYGPGVPDNVIPVHSDAFEKVNVQTQAWNHGTPAGALETKNWSTHEWKHFIRSLPDSVDAESMKVLDDAFHFSKTGNSEILFEWLLQSIRRDYAGARPALEQFLGGQGRRKYVRPLFAELSKKNIEDARELYARVRPLYHAVTRESVEKVLAPEAKSGAQ